jgi:hypothetical protein
MNDHYLIIAGGWFVGQIAYASVSVYILQKNKNIDYWKAWALYFSAEIGSFVMAFSGLLILLFIAGDFFNVEITRADLLNKAALTWKERIIVYQRTASVGVGAFIQHLLYVGFKRGKKRIEQYEIENQIEDKKP